MSYPAEAQSSLHMQRLRLVNSALDLTVGRRQYNNLERLCMHSHFLSYFVDGVVEVELDGKRQQLSTGLAKAARAMAKAEKKEITFLEGGG